MTLVIAHAEENNAKPIQGDTLLVYLIDRSGSMAPCWEETIGGLNTDLVTQKENDDGKTEAVFMFFDGQGYYSRPGTPQTRIVKPFEGPLTEAFEFDQFNTDYRPYGSTPLYDAVGQMIMEVKDRIDATPNGANVIVSIFTDGENTDNHGYQASEVKGMVETCEGEGWTFTYFGANQDAWKVGSSFGIKAGNTMSYTTDNMAATMSSASVARSMHVKNAKAAFASGESYTSSTYFADVGQSVDDYNK